jgi:hypothetical protein
MTLEYLLQLSYKPLEVERICSGMPMKVPRYTLHSADECYDEHEAKHRFESALRGARRAHAQRMMAVARPADEEHASSSADGRRPSTPGPP